MSEEFVTHAGVKYVDPDKVKWGWVEVNLPGTYTREPDGTWRYVANPQPATPVAALSARPA